jgi:hypothetical protein
VRNTECRSHFFSLPFVGDLSSLVLTGEGGEPFVEAEAKADERGSKKRRLSGGVTGVTGPGDTAYSCSSANERRERTD